MNLRGWDPSSAILELLEEIRKLAEPHFNLRNTLMGLQADVQKLVDAVAANTSLTQSIQQALEAEAKQISDLQAQVAALQPGAPIDAEDLTAIQTAVSQLSETNTALQAAVPATPPTSETQPVSGPSSTSNPSVADPAPAATSSDPAAPATTDEQKN